MSKMEKTGYLSALLKEIKLNAKHPRHHGVKMQAHHILSADGFHRSGKVAFFKGLGYDINAVENLVFIPSTPQAACHLEVQLHRGNHGSPDPDAIDDDGEHPRNYHDAVADAVRDVARKLEKKDICKENPEKRARAAQKALDRAARKIIDLVNSYSLTLSNVATYFAPQGKKFQNANRGCANADTVDAMRKSTAVCSSERNHEQRQASNQRSEEITYRKKEYSLKAGQ